MIHNTLRKLMSQSGQAVILFVGIFTIIAIVGAIVVDFGIWFSERRGAQTDSDLISLAGAYELLDQNSTFTDVDSATQLSALDNGIDPIEDLQNLAVRSLEFVDGYETDPDYCHTAADTGGRLNAVVLDVSHDSRAFFAGIFGLTAPDIGAHACARVGSLHSTSGLKPWAIPMLDTACFEWDAELESYVPLFYQSCAIRASDPPSQLRSIRLGDDPGDPCFSPGGGASSYKENIIEGADAVCTIGDFVRAEPGFMTGPTWDALEQLLETEGECDSKNSPAPDGIDHFLESLAPSTGVPGPDVTFTTRDCETPRFMHIVITDEFDGAGAVTVPIIGFGGFFLEYCKDVETGEIFERCDQPNNAHDIEIVGRFVRILEFEGDIGAFDPFGTNLIRLAE